MDSQTQSGDSYILSLARYIRQNEKQLSGAVLPSSSSSKARTVIPPKPFAISLHHLSYLLLRFDALGLSAGSLDEPLPASSRSRARSTFAYISSNEQGASSSSTTPSRPTSTFLNPETMSLHSVRSAFSRISLSGAASTTSSWFSSTPTEPPSPSAQLKYIYSAFTKLPALDLVPSPATGLIEGFEDEAITGGPTTLTPLDVFRNLHLLSFTDVDPRGVSGWDRLSCQLRSLSLCRSGVEDVEDFFVDHVVRDVARRRAADGETVDEEGAASTSASNGQANKDQLPQLAWHFLSSLCLPSSSLTFFPSLPLPSLRSLDLSHNLLISIPSSLSHLTRLVSLDLSGNLIEDTRGAAACLGETGVLRTLKLRGNRITSLSGLDSLTSLRQVDLRDNLIYEADELGRLAASLESLRDVWVKGNPLCEEYKDWRVEVLAEFLKEGWPLDGEGSVRLDGEGVGWFEKGRVEERVPVGARRARKGRGSESGGKAWPSAGVAGAGDRDTPAGEGSEAGPSAQIVAVKHRARTGSQHHRKTTHTGSVRRPQSPRKQRNLATVVRGDDEAAMSSTPEPSMEVSEAEQLKRKVLGTGPSEAERKAKTTQEHAITTEAVPRSRKNSARPHSPSKKRAQSPATPRASSPALGQAGTPGSAQNQVAGSSLELRARIERLKKEVGDDWMRVLSSGGGAGAVVAGGSGGKRVERRDPSS
ncbi:hypothetical protein BDZ90DRAFT_279399 [Jaminaea rosea]|uniref:L domain-like protein n=1 Tax=Jaminaea rosea TaxID=1569628 RepID=A0A316UQL6_9BASI|nr:hypothetical protein BDZ90DRAFT_279399 [Jaminaea rosea]PWN27609.1 hypothetical protein BDZ90DRAFT_279399 [Jaminaea rosea]